MNPDTQTHTYPKIKTPEEELDYKISVMQAFRNGAAIEFSTDNFPDVWKFTGSPLWDWQQRHYRIAPEKKKVPMTAEDFPPMFWVRNGNSFGWKLCHQIEEGSGWFNGIHRTFKSLMEEGWEYSTDRKEVKGCWKYE